MTGRCSGSDAERRWPEDVPGQQGVDGVDGMLADAGEDFAYIGFRFDAVQHGGADQGVEDGGPLPSGVAAREQPILSAKGNLAVILPISGKMTARLL